MITRGAVYPTIRVASRPDTLLMGVFDGSDDYVSGTVLDRRTGEQGAPVPRQLYPPPESAEEPEAIYAGPLYVHFGHFLLESLARLWFARHRPDLPIVWAGAHTWQGHRLLPWQQQILDVLQVMNPTRIIADPTRFDRLHIPDIGFRYEDRFHPQHAEFLGRYEGPAQVPGHRVWLSRAQAGNRVGDLNSPVTERRLADAGWTIVHPESLSIRQQLDHLARAETVAGEEGSAFHSLVLLRDVTAKRFRILRRQGREHGSLHTIGRARQVQQSFHTLRRERVLSSQGRFVSKLTPNASEILDLLDVPVPTATPAPSADDDLLRRTVEVLAPRRLLVVGAETPHLVLASTAPTRVAVAARFAFDPRTYAASGAEFFELGLIRYATTFHDDRGAFDLIRIDGADVATVTASFRASRRLAHQSTVWVLGSGTLAARAALAIRLTHPGFTARRMIVHRRVVVIVRREAGEPLDEARIGQLSDAEVRRRSRWWPITAAARWWT